MGMFNKSFFFLFSCLFVVILVKSYAQEPQFHVLTNTPCEERIPQINNSGLITWSAFCNGRNDIFLFENGKFSKLTTNKLSGQNARMNEKGTVVWQGTTERDRGIYIYSDGDIIRLTDSGVYAVRPSINDHGKVAWQQVVVETDRDRQQRLRNTIFLFDGDRVKRLDINISNAMSPDINNNETIVFEGWVDNPDPTTGEVAPDYTGTFEIFMFKNGRLKRLSSSETYRDNKLPRINDEGMVVWYAQIEDKTTEIYLYNGKEVKRITNNNYNDLSPEINNAGKIIWYGWDGHDFEIFTYYNGKIRRITDNDYNDINPSISDNNDVVWVVDINGYYQVIFTHLQHEWSRKDENP